MNLLAVLQTSFTSNVQNCAIELHTPEALDALLLFAKPRNENVLKAGIDIEASLSIELRSMGYKSIILTN